MTEDEPQLFQPSTGFGRIESLYATFRTAHVEPDSAQSREEFGDNHLWLKAQRARSERWSIRRSQILTGAAVALITAALSVFGPWIIHVLTRGVP